MGINQNVPDNRISSPFAEKCILVFPSRKNRCPKEAKEAYRVMMSIKVVAPGVLYFFRRQGARGDVRQR